MLQEGRQAFADGDYDAALLAYLRAAEMGYELGQSNAAWLITHVRLGQAHMCACARPALKSAPVFMHDADEYQLARGGHLHWRVRCDVGVLPARAGFVELCCRIDYWWLKACAVPRRATQPRQAAQAAWLSVCTSTRRSRATSLRCWLSAMPSGGYLVSGIVHSSQ